MIPFIAHFLSFPSFRNFLKDILNCVLILLSQLFIARILCMAIDDYGTHGAWRAGVGLLASFFFVYSKNIVWYS